MKYLLTLTLLSGLTASSQQSEFKEYQNGLIYNDTTMSQLSYIVDSLNLKFKHCDLAREYVSGKHACGHYITLKGGAIKKAMDDMKSGMDFDTFMETYPKAEVESDLLIVDVDYIGYSNSRTHYLKTIPLMDKFDYQINPDWTESNTGPWYFEQDNYSKSIDLKAFYLEEGLQTQPLPETYARMVQYSDCLVDTTTTIFLENPSKGWRHDDTLTAKQFSLFEYILSHKRISLNVIMEKDELELWQLPIMAKRILNDSITQLPEFKSKAEAAVKESLELRSSSEEFEQLIADFYSKESALELKRSRKVSGYCSQDFAPRYHAMSIALLSAETTHWETFLRAHLDIMNDHFSRASDGSYAQKGRKTYIRELEALDINVYDLLVGTSLQLDNPSANHYSATIYRVGRAFAETKDKLGTEANLSSMISDPLLDDYNRLIAFYLLYNYSEFLEEESDRARSMKTLIKSKNTLPEYLAKRITL